MYTLPHEYIKAGNKMWWCPECGEFDIFWAGWREYYKKEVIECEFCHAQFILEEVVK
jgi:hypothetical protein